MILRVITCQRGCHPSLIPNVNGPPTIAYHITSSLCNSVSLHRWDGDCPAPDSTSISTSSSSTVVGHHLGGGFRRVSQPLSQGPAVGTPPEHDNRRRRPQGNGGSRNDQRRRPVAAAGSPEEMRRAGRSDASRISTTELAAKKMLLPYIDKLAFIEIALAQVSSALGGHRYRPAGVPVGFAVRVVSKHLRGSSEDFSRTLGCFATQVVVLGQANSARQSLSKGINKRALLANVASWL